MSKYYNADELLSRHFHMNFVCGDRFGGKSTCFQRYVIRKAIKSKYLEQFAILVRYDKDIKTLCETYFDNTMMMCYPDYKLKFERGCFWIHGPEDMRDIWHKIGYGFALNRATKMKSTSYPLIKTMIMEEFMNLEDKYIKNANNTELEVELLISLYSTIARGNGKQYRDDVRVICISNNFYINNPYFRYYNLIDRIIANPFQRFYKSNIEPKCIVEMTHNDIHMDIGRDEVNKGSTFRELQNELKIIKNPVVNDVLFQLSLDNKEFINAGDYNDTMLFFSNGNKMRDNVPVFSCAPVRKGAIRDISVFKKDYGDIYKVVYKAMQSNTLFYDKLSTYVTLYDIMMFK